MAKLHVMNDPSPPARRLGPHTVGFTLLLGSLVTFASFATDMGLPVLSATAASMGVTPGRAALTLSVFLYGFAVGPLVFGPLSDHYGRRPILLTGCAAFAVFGALATFSRSLGALLAFRVAMGVGAGACQVLVMAMVRDLFTGHEARVRQSYVNLAGGIAPIIAPTLGVMIATLGGWRAIYAALATGGTVLFTIAALRLDESAPRRAGAMTLRATLGSYVRVLRHPVTVGNVAVMALCFGCLFAYVSGSSLVLINLLHVSRRTYGYLFASSAFGLMIGAFTSARLGRRGVPHVWLIGGGLTAVVVTALALLVLTLAGWMQAWLLVTLATLGFIGQGVARPNVAQGALEPMPEVVGVASAVLSGVQMVTGATASAIVAALFDGRTALAVTATMSVCAVLAAATYAFVVRPAERRFGVHTGSGTSQGVVVGAEAFAA